MSAKAKNNIPLVRPANGWNYRYVTTAPGEMLAKEFLEPLGLSQNQLAMNIHVPATRIGEIVRGKRTITPDTALRLARFFGNSPEFWLNLQQLHDLTKAKLALSKTIETEVRVCHSTNGVPCFPSRGGVITTEMVKQIENQID
jgi:addiction module HigA family antidote